MSKPKELSATVTPLQAEYIKSILSAKAAIESNLQTAVGMALAGSGVDMVQGMGYELKADRIVYTIP